MNPFFILSYFVNSHTLVFNIYINLSSYIVYTENLQQTTWFVSIGNCKRIGRIWSWSNKVLHDIGFCWTSNADEHYRNSWGDLLLFISFRRYFCSFFSSSCWGFRRNLLAWKLQCWKGHGLSHVSMGFCLLLLWRIQS